MSRKLTILNAANTYAQNIIPQIRGFNKILCGDIYNSRQSVSLNYLFTENQFITLLHKVKAQDLDTEYSHLNIHSQGLLEQAIKDSDTVLYFSHDYYSLVKDKNEQLINVSKIAKGLNVKRFIAVAPLEFVNFQTQNFNDNPVKELNDTLEETM